MSAGADLQGAMAAALGSNPALTGVYDGPPARAAFPYAVIDATTELDWGHKTGAGREVLVAVTVWDDQPVRLHSIADAAETQVEALSTSVEIPGWQLVTLRLLRRRVVRDVAGPWAAAFNFRARMLAA